MNNTNGQTLLDALVLPSILVARDERIVAVNEPGRALLGEAIIGRHHMTALRQPELLEAIQSCADTAKTCNARYLVRAEGGRDAIYLANCAWLDLSDLQGVLVSFEDRSHLEHADQMRRDFVANVSHELRTPLTSLLGFIETLRGPARDDASVRMRFLDIMQSEAARMERLVSDLLSLSRVESEQRVRPTEDVDLAALSRSVLHSLAPVAKEGGVQFVADVPDGEVILPGDEDQLRQVLSNLLENAVKYGGAGGNVTLSLRTVDYDPSLRAPAVLLEVADEGAGMDPIHIPRLTERFYRVDSHRSREVGGTGLGLAIVKHIVTRHRGRLRIDSALGEGSRFSVLLPL
ncbi:ATP-binding protein [Rhodobacteraceae bacterium D3-12]|nr:ATP-binding protein [Rhodobacteraceae bacterium D3-12]